MRETLTTAHMFSKTTVLHTCSCWGNNKGHNSFYKRSFSWIGVIAYFSSWSSSYHSSAPHLASKMGGQCVDRDKFDDRNYDSAGISEAGSEEPSILSSDNSLYSWGGEKCSLDGFNELGDSEEEGGESGEDNDDEFSVLDSFDRNRERGAVSRMVEVDEDELRHPLVREICRLIDHRAAWTPKLESELKNLLRSLKPSQVCAVLRAQSDERVALNFFYWADRQWRYRHDPMVYHAMLIVLGKTKLCQGAKRVLQLMMRRKIQLWPEDFGCVMVSFSRAGHLRKALQILTLMQRAGVELDISICNTAINVLVEGKRLEKALRFLERMQVVGIEPNVITYNCLIKGYCEGNQIENAMKLIGEMPKGCSPDKVSYYTVMGFLCKERRIDELRRLLEKMSKESKLLPDQVTYNTLIHMFSKNGLAEEALGFLREAEERGFRVDKVGYTAIINCFCQGGRIDRAKDIVDEMLSKGCSPDVVTYTAVLNGFCRVGEVDQAKKLLQQMYKNGCKPNCVSYTALLNGLCQSGKSSEAKEMMNMSEGWWTPNFVTYSVIMHGFRRERKLSEACDVVREMIRKGFLPSPVEINLLIQSLCQTGQTDEAKKFMEECLKKGCAVNVVNFTTVIHGFCQKGDLENALSVLDDMYLNNKHPDEVTYTTVIDALGRKGRIGEATEMTKKMLHRGWMIWWLVGCMKMIQVFCYVPRVSDYYSFYFMFYMEKMKSRECFFIFLLKAFCKRNFANVQLFVHDRIESILTKFTYYVLIDSDKIIIVQTHAVIVPRRLYRRFCSTDVKVITSSSSVLSSEELSPLRHGISGDGDNEDVSYFASKLRPINVGSEWLSRRMAHEDHQRRHDTPPFSGVEAIYNTEKNCTDNLEKYPFEPSGRNASPETISMEPMSNNSFGVSTDDLELNSPSSPLSSVCQMDMDREQIDSEILSQDHAMEQEEEDDAMSYSYVIEINSDYREAACESNGVDEAIAWVKEKFQTHINSECEKEKATKDMLNEDKLSEVHTDSFTSEIQTEIEILDEKINLWSTGKEADIRLLLSSLHNILWDNSGWSVIPLWNILKISEVKKAYQRACLCLHPDKLQQRGATCPQKYVAQKAFAVLQATGYDPLVHDKAYTVLDLIRSCSRM
ncbi:hypothetical protein BUALT_Bualt03G0022700 [Buddleja alternifolia]|uniref:Pentatricopeptide repeat-containing protein n=1 Tax=Buddleja alternifolia TaxID=168488 RepID=A0AAV6XYQ7_9LAMI|nr:hypothetical protein BUALT_Bualt03G0022700 [Buddleja alternifolia]